MQHKIQRGAFTSRRSIHGDLCLQGKDIQDGQSIRILLRLKFNVVRATLPPDIRVSEFLKMWLPRVKFSLATFLPTARIHSAIALVPT